MSSAQYVYAIVHRESALTGITSGGAGELATVPYRELAAVTRCLHNDDGASMTMKAVLQHELVVEALRDRYPALPVRFGTLFRDSASIAAAMAEQYDILVEDLVRVGDKAELGITALWRVPPSGEGEHGSSDYTSSQHAGARYLRARALELRRNEAQKEQAQSIAEKLNDAFGTLTLGCRTTLLPTPRIAVRVAYLLEPANVDLFRAAFDALRGINADIRLLLTGPWPPYNFVRRPDTDQPPDREHLAEFARLLTDALGERRGWQVASYL